MKPVLHPRSGQIYAPIRPTGSAWVDPGTCMEPHVLQGGSSCAGDLPVWSQLPGAYQTILGFIKLLWNCDPHSPPRCLDFFFSSQQFQMYPGLPWNFNMWISTLCVTFKTNHFAVALSVFLKYIYRCPSENVNSAAYKSKSILLLSPSKKTKQNKTIWHKWSPYLDTVKVPSHQVISVTETL